MIREMKTQALTARGEPYTCYRYFADFTVELPDGVREYRDVDLAPYGNRLPVFAAVGASPR